MLARPPARTPARPPASHCVRSRVRPFTRVRPQFGRGVRTRRVLDAATGRSRGVAFVQFEDAESAAAAIAAGLRTDIPGAGAAAAADERRKKALART